MTTPQHDPPVTADLQAQLAPETLDRIERWCDDHMTQGDVAAAMRLVQCPDFLTALVSAHVAQVREGLADAALSPIVDFYHWWREQQFVVGSGEADRLRKLGDLLHELLRPSVSPREQGGGS